MKFELLQQYLGHQANLRPDSVALVDGPNRLTYAELDRRSNSLACALRDAGCAPGDRLALLIPKSSAAIVSMFAALKAGCIYVPLDVDSPRSRLDLILDSSGSRMLLTVPSTRPLVEKLVAESGTPLRFALLSEERPEPLTGAAQPALVWNPLNEADAPPPCTAKGADIVHILFTSGSTGRPKGVMITHENIIPFIEWAQEYFGYTPEDRISGHPPLHFDLSTLDVYGTIAAGAQLHLVPPRLNYIPQKMAEFIRDSELTQWFSVPSLLSYMAKFDVVRQNDFPTLKRLLWCGERFPTPALMYWMNRLPAVQFTNLYGPTEATIASSFYTVPECPASEDAAIPIGVPCAGESLLVLDEQLKPLPHGEMGDLYIAGVGLSPGYWNDPEKTRSVFLSDVFGPGSGRIYKTGDLATLGEDGLVYLHGRSDSQVKSRGYRIELGEIEAVLHTTTGIQDVAVVAVESSGFEGAIICCAVVPQPGAAFEPQQVRQTLAQRLPHYMLPARWLRYEALPLNGNGKIDKPTIRQQFHESLHSEVR